MMAIKNFQWMMFFLLLSNYKVFSQTLQYQETNEPWYSLINMKHTEDGKWSYFIKRYEDESRKAFLISNHTHQKWQLPRIDHYYMDNNVFYYKKAGDTMGIFNLRNEKISTIPFVNTFFKTPGSPAYIWKKNGDLEILNHLNNIEIFDTNIQQVKSVQNDKFLLISKFNQVLLLNTEKTKYILNADFDQSNILAQDHNTNKKTSRFLLKQDGKYFVREYRWNSGLILNKQINAFDATFNEYVFGETETVIGIKPKTYKKNNLAPEIMDVSDPALLPYIEKIKESAYDARIVNYGNDSYVDNLHSINTSARFLAFSDKYIISVDELQNDTSTTEFVIPGIHLTNLSSGALEFCIQATRYFYPIENQGLLLYFENQHWYLYNVKTKKSMNITERIPEDFYQINRLNKKQTSPINFPYFTSDYKSILLTSSQNIWEINLKNLNALNKTGNTNSQLSFSILNRHQSEFKKMKWTDSRLLVNENIIVKAETKDELSEALYVMKDTEFKKIQDLGNHHFDQVILNDDFVSYTKEDFNSPYQLFINNICSGESSVVFYSNPLQNNMAKAKLFVWTNQNGGKEAQTIVLPPHYNKELRYPAIVRIYENEAKAIKYFQYPTYYSPSGFNANLLAMNNFIIIYPSIVYKENRVGESALHSVEESVTFAKKNYSIGKLGIIGHSFGGYETNFIISHSSLFDAAIAGASVSNLLSSYFAMSTKYLRPNIWRFTDQSFRFSAGFYDLKEDYLKNNPILFADKIKTPLLIWSGKEDRHVEWEQSLAFFNALKSLNKKSKLILFPKESHTLEKLDNQKLASQYFINWFNLYLK